MALTPFPYDQVQLTDSIFKNRFDLNVKYVTSLRTENLLERFYQEAGLTFQGFSGAYRVTMEGYGHSDDGGDGHWGWESPTSEIRGHFVGHWLSAAAHIYKTTGHPQLKLQSDFIVAELERCQIKNGNGWAASIPEKYLHWLAQGQSTWAPQYVAHKTMMGLYEMYILAGNEQALRVADRFADWFYRWTEPFSREQLDGMLDVETGAMLELWADLYGVTQDEKYLTLMDRYTRRRLFDPLLDGRDMLTNMHANSTIPEVHGAARAYEVTGDERWRQIAEAYWRCAVTDRGTYCTGGQTSGEIWTPPFEFAARLGPKTQEHCVVYNMIRLADYLFRWTGDSTYADYIERNTYNGILAQQNSKTGMVTYYLPLEAGGHKHWGSPTCDFWCCYGTLVQAHSRHNDYIYYRDEDGITVSQYIPSVLTTEVNGQRVRIQQSQVASSGGDVSNNVNVAGSLHRPSAWAIGLQITCEQPQEFTLKLRLPSWLSRTPSLTINGERQELSAEASGYWEVRRVWSDDALVLELPKQLTAIPIPDAPEMVAFADGPVVLAGLCEEERTLFGDIEDASSMLVPHHEREWGNWLTGYRTQHQPQGLKFKPLYEITDEVYTVYFPVEFTAR
jgi:DUF1680 family protein